MTLARLAQRLFGHLKPRSIGSFEGFSTPSLYYFTSNKRYHKTSLNLFSMKQQGRKTLREYIQRFNRTALEVSSTTSEILVNTFSQGLVEGGFFSIVG